MATPPSFIQEAETAWNTNATKTTASFSVQTGDVLVAVGIMEEALTWTLTVAGGSLVWNQDQLVDVSAYCDVQIATATATSNTSIQVTFTRGGAGSGNPWFGGNVLTFRGSDGVGASSKTNNASGAPSLPLTTNFDNSAIVVANGDYVPVNGASRTWRTVNGSAATEQSYFFDSVHYTVYAGYHPDAGAAGSKTVGLSAPGAQKYAIAAVEVRGAAGAAATVKQLAAVGVG